MEIQSLLNFTNLYLRFQKVARQLYVVKEDRKENDVEHSYQVAITCWYLIDRFKLKLNTEKVLKYSLIHDILEVYTGDYYFNINSQEKKDKEEVENRAISDLRKDLPGFDELVSLVEEYNNKENEEAKFVNAVEKLIPLLNLYLDEGRLWKEEGMKYDTIVENKDTKLSISDIPNKLWTELKPLLKKSGYLA